MSKLVTICFKVNGDRKTYNCGRHEIVKEITYLLVFENTEILSVVDHDGNLIDWHEPMIRVTKNERAKMIEDTKAQEAAIEAERLAKTVNVA